MAEQEIAALTLSITDSLTGLANRRGLEAPGGQVLSVAGRLRFPVELLFIDVDGMKRVNDDLGHEHGDRLLRDVAKLLEATFRDSDVIARRSDAGPRRATAQGGRRDVRGQARPRYGPRR